MKTLFFLLGLVPLLVTAETGEDIYLHYDEVFPHMRHSDHDDSRFHQAMIRAAAHHLKSRDNLDASDIQKNLDARDNTHAEGHPNTGDKLENRDDQDRLTRRAVYAYYKPDYDKICRHYRYDYSDPVRDRECVNPETFTNWCNNHGSTHLDVEVTHDCNRGFFCLTVERGTLTVVDPDNASPAADLDALCFKRVRLDVYRLRTSMNDFLSTWSVAPRDMRLAFGRMELYGDTTGVPLKMTFYKRKPGSKFKDNLGDKNILSTNHAHENEYEIGFRYNGADIEVAAGITTGPRDKELNLNVYFGFVSA